MLPAAMPWCRLRYAPQLCPLSGAAGCALLLLCGCDPQAGSGRDLLLLLAAAAVIAAGAFCIVRLRRAEQTRARAADRYRDLVEASHEAIVLFDHQGRARQANPAFLALTGHDATALAGGLAESDLVATPDQLRDDGEVSLRRQDGSEVPVLVRRRTWPGQTPDTTGGSGWVIHNLLPEREAEVALQAIQRRLRHTQKLDTLGRLAGGAAHDFNNILTAILGYAMLAKDSVPPDDVLHHDIEEIVVSAERARDLTSKLLTFSRQMPISTRPLNLNAVVLGLDNLLRRTMGEQIEVAVALDERIGSVRADPGQLEQVLLNLAVNARDAMPMGGTLRVETTGVTLTGQDLAHHPQCRPGPYVRLEVGDTGAGIPPELQDRVFEPFFSTKDADQGSGFGLVTVQEIVHQYGGCIELQSDVGRGTTFIVLLPAIDEPDQAVPVSVEEIDQATGDECIMVVEDQPAVLKLIVRLLAEAGYQVIPCANGQDALSAADRHPGPIDLVLSDVIMPKMNGPEAVRRLREKRPDVRVMFMSGYTEAPIMDPSNPSRLADFVRKPFKRNNLLRKIRSLLDQPVGQSPRS
jgi:PAS domain S-box-containing protein